MVKGDDVRRSRRGPDGVCALGVVLPTHLRVVEEVQVAAEKGSVQQLKAVAADGRTLGALEQARVVNFHLALPEHDAL